MKESIPPILRPERVKPVSIRELASSFGLTGTDIGDEAVTGISMNTNDLREGDLFVAMPGLKTHGARFAEKAVSAGAVAIITDAAGRDLLPRFEPPVPTLIMEHPRTHLGDLAAYVYGNRPGAMPKLFGTTGTNGKTSTTYLLEAILRQLGETTGLTSTAERHIAGTKIVSRLTTPESTEMQALLALMRERSCSAVAIEVSAQALTQLRVDGIKFDVVGFTNLSHDHFDDYPDFATYLRAKAELFTTRRANRGVVSLDSAFGTQFLALAQIPCVTVSSNPAVPADWNVAITHRSRESFGFELTGPSGEVISSAVPLIGDHMAANAALAVVMLIEAGYDWKRIAEALRRGIDAYLPGRTELVSGPIGPAVFVDFGHSPDAFLHTLTSLRQVTEGKIIMVFGADGDRDASKRPAMSQIAIENSDVLVITDHHPRFEDPAAIRKVLVAAALEQAGDKPVYEVSPPEQAIRRAISLAESGDSVLWAGPGHQDYRDIQGVRTVYSARNEARNALKENGWP